MVHGLMKQIDFGEIKNLFMTSNPISFYSVNYCKS